ncbi:uncharacterized protein LOC113147288 [Cyclospora cayetanensis]|uniref:GrpE protein homolog n=1 Tax=Cyclospora cayetanensis TaxID=88456 RepID=A0A6P6RZ54_9EIME|nr:uncharacterized protein LOC113147288 [Cyclospora cayetanensis]
MGIPYYVARTRSAPCTTSGKAADARLRATRNQLQYVSTAAGEGAEEANDVDGEGASPRKNDTTTPDAPPPEALDAEQVSTWTVAHADEARHACARTFLPACIWRGGPTPAPGTLSSFEAFQKCARQRSGEAPIQGKASFGVSSAAVLLGTSREALAAANTKIRELQDKLLRSLADQENARVRLSKEVASARDYAMSAFAKALLDVGDSLANAKGQLQQQLQKQQQQCQPEDAAKQLQQFFDGVSLTENLFHKTLERFGVEQYNPMGEKFDPSLHEALFEMDGPADKKGSVAQVVQTGYKIKDRVLRAAKVGVFKGQ